MNLKVGQCVSPARGSTVNPPIRRGRRDALPYSEASPAAAAELFWYSKVPGPYLCTSDADEDEI